MIYARCGCRARPLRSASKIKNVEAWLMAEGRATKELQAILDDVERPYYADEVLAA
jgi:hypothetical protein